VLRLNLVTILTSKLSISRKHTLTVDIPYGRNCTCRHCCYACDADCYYSL